MKSRQSLDIIEQPHPQNHYDGFQSNGGGGGNRPKRGRTNSTSTTASSVNEISDSSNAFELNGIGNGKQKN